MTSPMVALTLDSLPMQLDMACPIPWPNLASTSATGSTARPLGSANAASSPRDDDATAFIRQRYHQTLYLPDALAPLQVFAMDLLRLRRSEQPQDKAESQQEQASIEARSKQDVGPVAHHLLTLAEVEKKHRKVVPPLINSLLRTTLIPQQAGADEDKAQTASMEGVEDDEVNALQLGLEFRLDSAKGVLANAVNGVPEDLKRAVKRLTDELERREVMIQIILLLTYISHNPKKSSKKRSKKGIDAAASAFDDPRKTLDMLTDRMNVWQAVAGLADDPDAVKADEEGWIPKFCRDVVERYFGSSQKKLCASFHTKIFGSPPAEPVVERPASPTPSARSVSRAPSVQPTHSRRGSMESRAGSDFQRAGSVASMKDDARSRSRSRDPSAAPAVAPRQGALESLGAAGGTTGVNVLQSRRPGVRVTSGKNLFKGREVGLSRTSSFSTTMAAGALARQADAKGLMAVVGKRKTLYVPQGTRRLSGESLPAPTTSMGPPKPVERQVSAPQVRPTPNVPLTMATPSKPRQFGRAHTLAQVTRIIPPTPIQEAPSFVAETPSSSAGKRRRQSDDAGSAKRPTIGTLWPERKHSRATSSGDESLGQLMVDTDDEGDDPPMNAQSLPAYMVMETPRKG